MLGSKRPQNGEHEGERDEHQGGLCPPHLVPCLQAKRPVAAGAGARLTQKKSTTTISLQEMAQPPA